MADFDKQQAKQADPSLVEVFIAEWRSLICPLCREPLDMQRRLPLLLFVSLRRACLTKFWEYQANRVSKALRLTGLESM